MLELKKNKTLIYAIICCILLLVIDQITKGIIVKNNINITIIPNVLEIRTLQNTGGAFGIGEGNTGMFIITNLLVLGLIIRFIYLQKHFMDKVTLYSLITILAGGFGNIIDRIGRGFVVDFIKIFPSINFPTFNLADMYIVIGWVILAFVFALYSSRGISKSRLLKE